jgi:hypothetical protein
MELIDHFRFILGLSSLRKSLRQNESLLYRMQEPPRVSSRQNAFCYATIQPPNSTIVYVTHTILHCHAIAPAKNSSAAKRFAYVTPSSNEARK